jgi:hypothetical protein
VFDLAHNKMLGECNISPSPQEWQWSVWHMTWSKLKRIEVCQCMAQSIYESLYECKGSKKSGCENGTYIAK